MKKQISILTLLFTFSVAGFAQKSTIKTLGEEREFTNDLLRTGFNSWAKSSKASLVSEDTTLVSVLFGDGVVQTFSTNQGKLQLIFYRTADGKVYDVGMYYDFLHNITEEGGRFAVQIFERLLFALKTKNIKYADAAFGPNDIVLSSLLVGDKTEVLKGIFQSHKAAINFALNTYELQEDQHRFTLVSDNAQVGAITIGIVPSLGLVLGGQTFLYQNYLQNGFVKGEFPEFAGKIDRFDEYYKIKSDGVVDCFETREYQPYLNDYCFEKQDTKLVPYFEKDEDPIKSIVTQQAYYWMSILLKDRSAIEFPQTTQPQNISVRLMDFDAIEVKLPLEDFVSRMKSALGVGLPTYFGVMKTRTTAVGFQVVAVCSIVDPFLQVEHVLRITDSFERKDENVLWTASHIDGYLGIRLDNVSNLKYEAAKDSSMKAPKISIDLRKN